MADDNKLSWELDLDDTKFVEGAQGALDAMTKLTNTDSVKEMLALMGDFGIALGAAGIATFAFKEALDFTIEGEEIQRIQNQFTMLAAQAGVNGDEIKDGMERASGGLLTTTQQLEIANKALVQMGDGAARLPEIMELARKATAVFGGDLQTNFQNMVQAISAGNARMLKHMGIVVDTQAAEQKLATQLGVTTAELSNAGKQTAILNAVLEQGGKAFQGVDVGAGSTKTAIQELKVAWMELKELFAVFASAMGPQLAAMFQTIADKLHTFKLYLNDAFGGAAAGADRIELVKKQLQDMKVELIEIEGMNSGQGFFSRLFKGDPAERAKNLQYHIALNEAYLKKLEADQEKAHEKEKERAADSVKVDTQTAEQKEVNAKKVLETNQKVEQELRQLRAQTTKFEAEAIQNLDQVDKNLEQQKLDRARAHADAIQKINTQYGVQSERAKQLRAAEDQRFYAQERAEELKLYDERVKLLQSYQKTSQNIFQAIGRSARTQSAMAEKNLHDMAKVGNDAFNVVEKSAVSGFAAIGQAMATNQQIGKAVAAAMKSAFLGMIGQAAQSYGEMLLLEGLFPPNPVALTAGAALIALGGALSALAGSSGGIPSGGGGAGGSTAGALTNVGTNSQGIVTPDQNTLSQQQNPQRTVVVNIAGHYLNTPQSQRTLMEMMRNEADATGFQYNQIGAH